MNARTRNFTARKSLTTQSGDNLNVATRGSLYDLQSQTRRATQLVGYRGNKRPQGLKDGDVTVRSVDAGQIAVGISDSSGDIQEVLIAQDLSGYVAYQSGSGAPTVTTNFPDDGDFGWYLDTSATALYWVRNVSGTLMKPHFLSISGSLQTGQHGDRSAEAGTMHDFIQVSGSITAAQHGNFAAIAANDNLHGAATTSRAGFMSASDKTDLNASVADLAAATTNATANTLARRGASANINFNNVNATGEFQVAGTRVVTNRQTGWVSPTGTASRATFDTATVTTAQLAQRVYALLQDLGNTGGHGLISSV